MEIKKEIINFEESIPFAFYETNARQFMMHAHDCLEINLILRGNGYYLIEDQTCPIHENDIFIINNLEHHMAVHDGNLFMLVYVFSPEFVMNGPEEMDLLKSFFYIGNGITHTVDHNYKDYTEMKHQLLLLKENYTEKGRGWELMIKSRLLLFLAHLNRYFMEKENEGTLLIQKQQGYSRIRDVIGYIHENFDRELSLQELAQEASMGKSYFSGYFKNVMKMSVFDYIESVRVNHAAMLLQSTSYNMEEIAFRSGFNSSAYFSRVFKKKMNMTPSSYKKSKNSAKRRE